MMYDRFEEDDSSWSFALGLLVGAIVGAAVASLFTPRSGAQNREAVIERGLVLRDRVTEATDSVSTSIRDTANTVKDRASEGAERVGAVAGATLASVQEAANSAAATVSDVATTAAERAQTMASTAGDKVQEVANSAAATVSEVASTVNMRAQEVAGTVGERAQDVASKVQGAAGAAADRARQISGRETTGEFEIPAASEGIDGLEAAPAEQDRADEPLAALDVDAILDSSTEGPTALPGRPEALAAEARYDAEDVRSAAVDSVADEQEQLDSLASIDAVEDELTTETLPPLADEPMDLEAGTDAASEAQAELSSSEQFEVDEQAAPLDQNTTGDETQRPA